MIRSSLIHLPFCAALCLGCCDGKPKAGDSVKDDGSSPTIVLSSAPSASSASSVSSALAPASETPPFPVPPDGKSKAPMAVDWKKAKTAAIPYSAELGCQASILQEWVQVVCKEGPLTGRPSHVAAVKDGGEKLSARTSEGRTSVIFPVRRGSDLEFRFQWAGWGDRTLRAVFAEGKAVPEIAFDRGVPLVEESPISLSQVAGEKKNVGRMILVPAGSRKGKSPVGAFYLDETEVTFRALSACVEEGGCAVPSGGISCARTAQEPDPFRPVSCATYGEAEAYCKWATKRLPTDEEWLYAYSGSDGRAYPWGNTPVYENTCGYQELVWVETKGKSRLLSLGCKVGLRTGGKGPFGQQDMLSNVAEWTSSEKDGKKIVLGSSFGTVSGVMDWKEAWTMMMSSFRQTYAAETREVTVGFRCARDSK